MQLLGVSLLLSAGLCAAFRPMRFAARQQIAMKADNSEFSALEEKLASKKTGATTAAPKKAIEPVRKQATVVAPSKPVAAAPARFVASVSKPSPVVSKPVAPVTIKSTAVAPSTPSALSTDEFLAGVGLGIVPFLAIPVVLFSVAKGLVSKPKPIDADSGPKPKVQPYSKPLSVGAKEGIDELLSGKVTKDLEVTRKGIKFSAAGFGVGAGLLVVSLLLGGVKEEVKEVKKPSAPSAKVAAPVAPKAPVVVAPAPAPAPVKAPEAPKVDTAAADKAAAAKAEKAAADRAASDKAAAEKAAVEKAAVEKAAAEKVAAEKAAAEKAAAEKSAAAKVAAEKVVVKEVEKPKVEVPKVEAPKPVVNKAAPAEAEYKAPVPKGMEPDVVDISQMKALMKKTRGK